MFTPVSSVNCCLAAVYLLHSTTACLFVSFLFGHWACVHSLLCLGGWHKEARVFIAKVQHRGDRAAQVGADSEKCRFEHKAQASKE